MNEIDVIKGARDILATSGRLHKGGAHDGKGNYCVLGALQKAGVSLPLRFGPIQWAQIALLKHLPESFDLLIPYNDDPATTLQDMLDLIDKTLANLGAL